MEPLRIDVLPRSEEEAPTVPPGSREGQSAVTGICVSPALGSVWDDAAVLDERDLAILTALQAEARATYADVGATVGLSASAVHERVRKLEQHGVIRGYRAIVDPEAVGLYVTALIAAIPLDPHQPDDLPARVKEFPEVEDCYSVAGEANYVLKVRTKTTGDLEDLIRRLREKAAVTTNTTIALSIPFEGRPLRP